MIVHHEPIPGVMDAMLMTVPVDRPGSLDTLDTGTPIAFDLHVADAAIQARNIRVLPDTTALHLPPDAPADTSVQQP
jgi:Cu/Ag efflux protein CusF